MRIGYSYWGFLGDNKIDAQGREISSPDGNATYSWTIINEALERGHQVYMMQRDRDFDAWKLFGAENFAAFNKTERASTYRDMIDTAGSGFPELDVLLLEWRFPIVGRNCVSVRLDGVPEFGQNMQSPDLLRQTSILKHYTKLNERNGGKTKIIIWDLDHKLTAEEESLWRPDAIFETSVRPRRLTMDRIQVDPPCHIDSLLQHSEKIGKKDVDLAYIGSRYERDEMIDKLYPWARYLKISFHGKWDDDAQTRWPNISFGKRITTKDFLSCYLPARAVPLLAKNSYLESGFVTPRIWEALLFCSLPIGFVEHQGIEKYVERTVTWEDLGNTVQNIQSLDSLHYKVALEEAAHKISFMDAKFFMNKLEEVASS